MTISAKITDVEVFSALGKLVLLCFILFSYLIFGYTFFRGFFFSFSSISMLWKNLFFKDFLGCIRLGELEGLLLHFWNKENKNLQRVWERKWGCFRGFLVFSCALAWGYLCALASGFLSSVRLLRMTWSFQRISKQQADWPSVL